MPRKPKTVVDNINNNSSSNSRGKRIIYKQELREGRLLERVEYTQNENKVRLLIKSTYDNEKSFRLTCRMLRTLYKQNKTFQDKYKFPIVLHGKIFLLIKPEYKNQTVQQILDDLMIFAADVPKSNNRKALAKGHLIHSVTLEREKKVKLNLQEKYNKKELFYSINRSFYDLYCDSKEFQAKFAPPHTDNRDPELTLKKDHGYHDTQQILNDLIRFADLKQKSPQHQTSDVASSMRATVKNNRSSSHKSSRSTYKKALHEGKLIEGVKLKNKNEIELILSKPYDDSKFYMPIRKMLYEIYKLSGSFIAKFELPADIDAKPSLILKPNHGYKNGLEILSDLVNFAASNSDPKISKALKNKTLFASVTKKGNLVVLNLNEEFNQETLFKPINTTLNHTYKHSAGFRAKFYIPACSYEAPVLALKPGHGYQNEAQIFDDLIRFASPKQEEKDATIQQINSHPFRQDESELELELEHNKENEISSYFSKDYFDEDLLDELFYSEAPNTSYSPPTLTFASSSFEKDLSDELYHNENLCTNHSYQDVRPSAFSNSFEENLINEFSYPVTPLFEKSKASHEKVIGHTIDQTPNAQQSMSHYGDNYQPYQKRSY